MNAVFTRRRGDVLVRPQMLGLLSKHGVGAACWPLRDAVGTSGAGSVADLRGLYPATPSATGLTFGAVGPVLAGHLARACTFASLSSGYINLGNLFSFERTALWTVMAWIKTTHLTTNQLIISRTKADTTNRGWMFYVRSSDKLAFLIRNDNASTKYAGVSGGTTVTDGIWHHVVATYTGTSNVYGMALYVDGVAESLTLIANSLGINTIITTASASIGSIDNAATFFNGSMAYVSVLPDVALTASDVRTVYRNQKGI